MVKTERIDAYAASPGAIEALLGVEAYIRSCSLESSLIELVKMRASQINGCARCLDMHARDARAAGEDERRLYLLDGWRESTLYTPRERAALGWTEALTLVAQTHAPDDAFEPVHAEFTDAEIADLTTLIGQINTWNRLAIGLRAGHA